MRDLVFAFFIGLTWAIIFWTGVLYEKKFGKPNDSVMEFLD